MKTNFPKPRFSDDDQQTQYLDSAWEFGWATALTLGGAFYLFLSLHAYHYLIILIGFLCAGSMMVLGLALWTAEGMYKVFVLHTLSAIFSACCVIPVLFIIVTDSNHVSNSFIVIVLACVASLFKWIGNRAQKRFEIANQINHSD